MRRDVRLDHLVKTACAVSELFKDTLADTLKSQPDINRRFSIENKPVAQLSQNMNFVRPSFLPGG